MMIGSRFCLLYLTISLAFLASCTLNAMGEGASNALVPNEASVEDVSAETPVLPDAVPDTALPESLMEVGPDAEAGMPEADAEPEADATAEDALAEPAEDVQEEPDAFQPDAAEEDVAEEDAAQEPDVQIQDVQPDNPVEDALPDVEDAKSDAPTTLCQQYMQGVNDYMVIGQSPIGGSVRISIFGSVDFPADSGLSDTPMSGWCWGNLGQTTVACLVPVPGIVPDTYILVHPGISIGVGDPQTAPLCETGICNQTYTLCHGPDTIGIVNGSATSPGTVVPDQTIKYHVPL